LPTSSRGRPSCGGIFDFDAKRNRLAEVIKLAEDPAIWQDNKRAQEIGKERKALETVVTRVERMTQALQDSRELLEMARDDNDESGFESVAADVVGLEKSVAEMEFRRMFSNPMDPNNCFLDIQSGSGGTEAQDWASMLERMYFRFGERRGFLRVAQHVNAIHRAHLEIGEHQVKPTAVDLRQRFLPAPRGFDLIALLGQQSLDRHQHRLFVIDYENSSLHGGIGC